jgi:hypothetical protein
MNQIDGALLGDKNLLMQTNCHGKRLEDLWTIGDVKRLHVKKALTPMLYGSTKSVRSLWKQNRFKFERKDVRIVERALTRKGGVFAPAVALKDYIIENVKPSEKMTVTVWKNTFEIECNKYRSVGDYAQRYDVFDTESGLVKTIYHTHTKRVPDLDQFRRYFKTLLNHGIDSQIEDELARIANWIIPIHDASIVPATEAVKIRTRYCELIDELHRDRLKILNTYFKCLGLPDTRSQIFRQNVMEKVTPVKDFKCLDMALK